MTDYYTGGNLNVGGGGIYYNYGYTCSSCHQWVTYNGHVCSGMTYYPTYPTIYTTQLESKPKYEEHTLECGCKVKTVVTEHCETLHKAPENKEDE